MNAPEDAFIGANLFTPPAPAAARSNRSTRRAATAVAMTNSVFNSGLDSTRPPGPDTDRLPVHVGEAC